MVLWSSKRPLPSLRLPSRHCTIFLSASVTASCRACAWIFRLSWGDIWIRGSMLPWSSISSCFFLSPANSWWTLAYSLWRAFSNFSAFLWIKSLRARLYSLSSFSVSTLSTFSWITKIYDYSSFITCSDNFPDTPLLSLLGMLMFLKDLFMLRSLPPSMRRGGLLISLKIYR